MTTAEYLKMLLLHYSGSFDIYQPYLINGKEFSAYGYFYSCVEKYVLVREANLWTSDSYEHILFWEVEECIPEMIQEAKDIMKNFMEPELVRKGNPLPEKNHMYSYLTIVFLSQKPLSEAAKKQIKKFRFEKGYRFNLHGYSQGRIICASMEKKSFYSNYQGRKQKELFMKVFDEINQ